MKTATDTRAESMLIPMAISRTHYNLIFILSPKSVERTLKGDPFDGCMEHVPGQFHNMKLHQFMVCTPTEKEMQEILRLSAEIEDQNTLVSKVFNILTKNKQDLPGDNVPYLDVRRK